jgi:uncharacterized protein YlxW (UPF0749 family)
MTEFAAEGEAAVATAGPGRRVDASKLLVGVAAALVGLMVVTQLRLEHIVPPPSSTSRLLTLLKAADERQTRLQAEVTQLHQELAQKLTAEAAAKRLSQELTQAEILAGTVPVTGPGIIIRWSNGTAPAAFQIQDIDLLLLVNELRAAGANAIAINGQRITGQSEIRNAANYILINNSQQAAPFTIEAIGPVSTMVQAIELPGGLMDQSVSEGRTMKITTARSLTLPSAVLTTPQYGRSAVGGAGR